MGGGCDKSGYFHYFSYEKRQERRRKLGKENGKADSLKIATAGTNSRNTSERKIYKN